MVGMALKTAVQEAELGQSDSNVRVWVSTAVIQNKHILRPPSLCLELPHNTLRHMTSQSC